MTSLIQTLGNRTIGSVEQVSADRITTLLEPDAPQATALNAGAPFGFPRINGYVLIPNESSAIACIISSVRIQRQHLQGKRGSQQASDFVDLPFPSRLMELTPIGTLKSTSIGDDAKYKVQRGVDFFPSVGAPVLLPTKEQLQAIVAGEDESEAGHVLLGHCPTADMASVHVDPDKLFGRHLAILGNTGSGKSCSVAGLIHWSLKAAREERLSPSRNKDCDRPNARFIVLDPNGEYSSAFKDQHVRIFQVGGGDRKKGRMLLRVPAWLLNGEEWVAFTKAASGVQSPILFETLRRLRAGLGPPDEFETKVKGRVVGYKSRLKVAIEAGDHQKWPGLKRVVVKLLNIHEDFMALANDLKCEDKPLLREKLRSIANSAKEIEEKGQSYRKADKVYHNEFSYKDIEEIVNKLQEIAEMLGLSEEPPATDENAPIWFPIEQLPEYIEALAADHTGRDMAQFVDTLNLRIRGLLHNEVLSSVFQTQSSQSMTLEEWLTDYIGDNEAKNGTVAVVDLSLVPTEVIHIIVSVLARMIFEASQRYRRENDRSLPTTLVLEEAHTFIHRGLTSESASPASRACAEVFEKIAREGRKFGLGLVLASQSPSEIAPTVLSQCNTFLLHRLAKDSDQDLVKRLVPDSLGMLLRELPSLPTRRAILLGWAAPAPTLVEIKEIPKDHRPHSPDPAFWDVWIGKEKRPIKWEPIARKWQRRTASDSGQEEQKPQNT